MSLPILDFANPELSPLLVDKSLVISASAGSGKTFTLVTLVMGFLGRDGRAHEVLATTFGREAASDLKGRILQPLDQLSGLDLETWEEALRALHQGFDAWKTWVENHKLRGEIAFGYPLWKVGVCDIPWAQSPEEAQNHWIRTRREAENLAVSTVHALALDVLRDSGSAEGELLEAAHPVLLRLLRAAGREVLQLPSDHPDAPAAQALLHWCESSDQGKTRWMSLAESFDAHLDALGTWRKDLDTTPLRLELKTHLERILRRYAEYVENPIQAASFTKQNKPHSNFIKYGLEGFVPECSDQAPFLDQLDGLQRIADRFLEKEDLPGYYSEDFKAFVSDIREHVLSNHENWISLLLEQVFQRFKTLKAEQSLRSYGDLVREAWTLLQERPPQNPPRLLLVDEYQDVNPVQEAFLEALKAARSIIVGDPKQAIYGFRGGVSELLISRIRLAQTPPEAGQRNLEAFRLPRNHRSSAPIVALANAFVADVMPTLEPTSADPDGCQESGADTGEKRVALACLESGKRGGDLPGAGRWIAPLAQEAGWQALGFPPRSGRRRRALLIPRRTGLPDLRRYLQKHSIEALVQSQEGFWESPGVRLMLTLLEAVLETQIHRDQSHVSSSQLAILRSAWGSASDQELQHLIQQPENPSPAIEATRAWLFKMANGPQNTQDLFAQGLLRPGLLEEIQAHRAHGAMEVARALRNLEHFMGLVLTLPSDPRLAWAALNQMRQCKDPGDAPADGEAADLVIQTVHASKGLEYDDVFLPMLSSTPKTKGKGSLRPPRDGQRDVQIGWKLGKAKGPVLLQLAQEEKSRAFKEGLNLLYVGLTRAKDRMLLIQQWSTDQDGLSKSPDCARERVAKGKSANWSHIASTLFAAHPVIQHHEIPALDSTTREVLSLDTLQPPPDLPPLSPQLPETEEHSPERIRKGLQLHALLRECLARDTDNQRAYLDKHPIIQRWPESKALITRFLDELQQRQLHTHPRRMEFELGEAGRADLVIWEGSRQAPSCIHLLDFKFTPHFGEEALAKYREQLKRYQEALQQMHPGVEIKCWLIPLEGEAWVEVK